MPLDLNLNYVRDALPAELYEVADPVTRGGTVLLAALADAWQQGYDRGVNEEMEPENYPTPGSRANPYVRYCEAVTRCNNYAAAGSKLCEAHRVAYLQLANDSA